MALSVEVLSPDIRVCPPTIKTLLLEESTCDRERIRRMSARTDRVVDLAGVSDIAA